MVSVRCLVVAAAVCQLTLPGFATVILEEHQKADSGSALRGAKAGGCQGEAWCSTVEGFAKLFDTNNPATMQQAVDKYSEWDSDQDGIQVSVTATHFYVMYHENVQTVLERYQGLGYFGWNFGGDFQQPAELNDADTSDEVTLVRDGTLTMNLGWSMRGLFWSSVVKGLPHGQVFPYSHVSKFDDCNKCASKMVMTLKKGGLTGKEDGWKVVHLSIVKLA